MHTTLIPEPIKLTYQDYCALPDDGRRYEILDGDLYMSPAPFVFHQRLVLRLATVLKTHVEAQDLGEVFIPPIDVILSKHNVVQPDVVFVSQSRREIVGEKNINGAPDLLVEVLSSSSVERDTRDKRNIYARCGVDHYWLIDPDETRIVELKKVDKAYAQIAEVAGRGQWRPQLFPNLIIDLAKLWG